MQLNKIYVRWAMFFAVPLVLAISMSLSNQAQAQSKDNKAEDFIAAKLIKEVKPSYPSQRSGKVSDLSADSGQVEVLFMVDESGATFEPTILRSTHQKFEKEALRALAKYQYKPATLGSTATESSQTTTVAFKFEAGDLIDARGTKQNIEIERTRGLTDGYSSFYEKFTKELNKATPSKKKSFKLIKRIEDVKHHNFYSLSYLALAKYRFAELFGTSEDKIKALEYLIWVDTLVEPKYKILLDATKQTVWSALLKLLIENGYFAEAIISYEKVTQEDKQSYTIFAETIQKIISLRDSQNVVQRSIVLGNRGYHSFPLLKNSFMLEQVKGTIDSLALRCDAHFQRLDFKLDSQYQIPKSWGECNLQVIGGTDTTAVVLQQ